MMTGLVNAALEATIRLIIEDHNGQRQLVDVVIDTGFNGFLTLPPTVISALGLPWLCRQQGQLADGSFHIFDVHSARIQWDGQPRTVEVEAVNAQPLIGMDLLRGFELVVAVKSGGVVRIAAIP